MLSHWRERFYNALSHVYHPLAMDAYCLPRKYLFASSNIPEGAAVLDLACGTGLNFPFILEQAGPRGHIVGIDSSWGMLKEARSQGKRHGWSDRITLIHEDARLCSAELLERHSGVRQVDALVCTLGLSVISDFELALTNALSVVRGGGRCVVMDTILWDGARRVLNPLLVPVVMTTAAADIRRATLQTLAGRIEGLRVEMFKSGHVLARRVFVATGTKPNP